MIRVGYLTYLNVTPFYWESEKWGVELIPCMPSEFGKLAAQGKVDAGIMSVMDWIGQEANFEPLGMHGVCSYNQAQSVLLFSQKPIEKLDGKVIGVTQDTSTSVRLMQLILEQRYHLQPGGYLRNIKGKTWLEIGDNALREKKGNTMPYVYDLGEEWMKWQNLPFVFARWVVRNDLAISKKRYLLEAVHNSFEKGMKNLEELAAFHAKNFFLSDKEISTYLRNFTYVIGDKEEAGLAQFRALLRHSVVNLHYQEGVPAVA
ncbi:MAG: menaquinone biosynthesis protein [Chroococcidiopsidaceae cyanobacterium CP_BM_RX_35]|nr:menaquinone biosynthesis protein [Chroococcidiopsidaceae cyanobacterium CP_BM_RX_35]